MTAIVVDDEELALGYLTQTLKEAQPDCRVHAFTNPEIALEFSRKRTVDLAFLDVEMFGMNGIELAKRFKDAQPTMNIIFVTGFPEYAVDAFALHASGYLLKPASVESVRNEIANLRMAPTQLGGKYIIVQTFGSFEVFHRDVPVVFTRSKTKELFAYLIDRKGAGSTTAELCAVLWEDKEYSVSLQKQFQTIVSDLTRTLRQVDADCVILKKRNFLSVDTTKIDCDYYRFLEGDVSAINSYMGEYMVNYSWAEFTSGFLYQMTLK